MTSPTDPCHHPEHQRQGRACAFQSPDGGTYGHVEPDPGPLGLHSAEEGCSDEDLHIIPQLLGFQISSPTPLAAQYTPQLNRDQQLGCWPV